MEFFKISYLINIHTIHLKLEQIIFGIRNYNYKGIESYPSKILGFEHIKSLK